MMTGLAVRLAQGLQINVERSDHNFRIGAELSSPSARESRRRLMWSIYAMDAWVGSGVDELTLIREVDLRIRLPCNERDFILECPGDHENTQGVASCLSRPPTPDLDVAAHFARLVSIRRRVLRSAPHKFSQVLTYAPTLLSFHQDM